MISHACIKNKYRIDYHILLFNLESDVFSGEKHLIMKFTLI